MPGPLPKPGARRRRNHSPTGTVLPVRGRLGAPPKWPLSGRAPKVWRELWSTPQAVAWENAGLERVVARYARMLADAEKEGAKAALLAEVRNLEDRLGLSPLALAKLHWTIQYDDLDDEDELAAVHAINGYQRRLAGHPPHDLDGYREI